MNMTRKTRLSTALAAVLGGTVMCADVSAVNLAGDGIGEVAIAPYYTTRDGWQTLVNLTNTTQHPVVVKLRVHEAWNSRDVFDINILMSAFDNFTALLTESGDEPVFRVVDTDTCTAPLGTAQAAPGDALEQREWPLSVFAFGGGSNAAATREWDGGPTDVDRLREGYVEFLVMGHYTNDGGPNDVVRMGSDENGDGIPGNDSPGELIEAHSCVALDNMFGSRNNVLTAAQYAGEPINALKFNYRLINVARGVEAGGSAVAWTNFFNPGPNAVDGEILSGDGTSDRFGIDAAGPWPQSGGENNIAGVDPDAGIGCTITRGAERSTASSAPGTTEWNPDWGQATMVGGTTGATAGPGEGSCLNLITAQTTFDFLEPTLNDAFPVVANGWVDRYNLELEANNPLDAALVTEGRYGQNTSYPQDANGNGSIRGIDAVSLTIQRSAIINEWAQKALVGGTGVVTDWIVNFPTKTFYVDRDPYPNVSGRGQQAGLIPGDRDEAYYGWDILGGGIIDVAYPPFREAFISTSGGSVVANNRGSCVGVVYNVYDRMENTLAAGGGSIPSPAPPIPGQDICYEANVLTFNGVNALGSAVSTDVDTGSLTDNGWLHLSFSDPEANAAGSGDVWSGNAGGLVGWSGLPTAGFVVKQRAVGDVGANYASSMDHGYRRTCEETSAAWASPFVCSDVLVVDPN